VNIECGFFWMDEHFQSGITYTSDFKFTGRTRMVDRDLEVEVIAPFDTGFFFERIVYLPEWVSANSFRVSE
jgi:hypothetical protein